jgi:hypothetical protein
MASVGYAVGRNAVILSTGRGAPVRAGFRFEDLPAGKLCIRTSPTPTVSIHGESSR